MVTMSAGFVAPGLCIYQRTAIEDVWITNWWHQMVADGDLDRTFASSAQTIRGLFDVVTGPGKVLLYKYDTDGIWFSLWMEAVLSGAFCGMWVRRDRRHTRRGLAAVLSALDTVLTHVPVLIGVTKQPELAKGHLRLGYRLVGEIPRLFGGETATIFTLTRPDFETATARYRKAHAFEEIPA